MPSLINIAVTKPSQLRKRKSTFFIGVLHPDGTTVRMIEAEMDSDVDVSSDGFVRQYIDPALTRLHGMMTSER